LYAVIPKHWWVLAVVDHPEVYIERYIPFKAIIAASLLVVIKSAVTDVVGAVSS
jgi:hypothetical protein